MIFSIVDDSETPIKSTEQPDVMDQKAVSQKIARTKSKEPIDKSETFKFKIIQVPLSGNYFVDAHIYLNSPDLF